MDCNNLVENMDRLRPLVTKVMDLRVTGEAVNLSTDWANIS